MTIPLVFVFGLLAGYIVGAVVWKDEVSHWESVADVRLKRAAQAYQRALLCEDRLKSWDSK